MDTTALPEPIAYDRVPDTIWSRLGYGVTKRSAASSHVPSSTRPTNRSMNRTASVDPGLGGGRHEALSIGLALAQQEVGVRGPEDHVHGRRDRLRRRRASPRSRTRSPCRDRAARSSRITLAALEVEAGLDRVGIHERQVRHAVGHDLEPPLVNAVGAGQHRRRGAGHHHRRRRQVDERREDLPLCRRSVDGGRCGGSSRPGGRAPARSRGRTRRRGHPRSRTRAGSRSTSMLDALSAGGGGRGSPPGRRAGCGDGPRTDTPPGPEAGCRAMIWWCPAYPARSTG